MLKDLGALVAPTVMAIMFVAVVVSILRSQNNSRRRARDGAAADRRPAGTAQSESRPATDPVDGVGEGDMPPASPPASAPLARPGVDGASGDVPLNAE